ALLALPAGDWPEREGAWTAVQALTRLRWPWAPAIGPLIARPQEHERWLFGTLPEWDDGPPRPAPRTITVPTGDAEARLVALTGDGAEERPGQRAFAAAASAAFAPRAMRDAP
ncbi:hypothetical protein ACTGW1_12075, partial [Streptococcus suis]